MLLGAPANTGTGSQSANQNGLDTSTMQAAAPFIGNGFSLGMPANNLFTSGQQAQQPSSFMQLLQSLMGVKEPQPPSPYGETGFASPGFQPSPEQAARIQQLSQTFPQSRNIIDVRSVPQTYPQAGLPIQQMGWGIQGALQANPSWPRPAQPPMQRYGTVSASGCARTPEAICGCDCLRVLTQTKKEQQNGETQNPGKARPSSSSDRNRT
jgi:hypothetical protein